ncbi:condensation domain-containing protein [Mycobacterium szulgai]|uniref:condensation domain-containing protein n=1 Tax=Mycobacterium szulgai TaxID=1787 RepID=UPI003FD71742
MTPSDIAPARLSQQQIDELEARERIADVLPLTPVQQGLLFHASTAQISDDVYTVQLNIAVTGRLDVERLRGAVAAAVDRHPHVVARFCTQFDEPVQVIAAAPAAGWRYVELEADDQAGDSEEQVARLCADERAAVCDLEAAQAFRVMLVRTGSDRYRFVLTNHHIVLDGWSMPILLREIFALYFGQRLAAAGSYRRFVSWLADRDPDARARYGGRCSPALRGPRWLARGPGWGWVPGVRSRVGCPPKSRGPLVNWRGHVRPR